MTRQHDDPPRHIAQPWPWPVGPWFLPAYWLVIFALAGLSWWFH